MSSSGFPLQGDFYIKSQNGSVLDVYDGETKEEAKVIIWPQKQNDNQNQLWSFDEGFLVNKKSGLVLDIQGGDLKSDRPIIQYQRKVTKAHNQRWGFRDGYIYVLADPRLVLDVRGGGDKDGTKVILYRRKEDDNVNQQWSIEPTGAPKDPYGGYGTSNQYPSTIPVSDQSRGLAGYGPPDTENSAYNY